MTEQNRQGLGAPHVDPVRMADLVKSLGGDLRDVIDAYLEDTPQIISEMRRCSAAEDVENLSRLAHSLKSSSGIFGADRLAAVCRALEASESITTVKRGEMISDITEAFADVRDALELYRNG